QVIEMGERLTRKLTLANHADLEETGGHGPVFRPLSSCERYKSSTRTGRRAVRRSGGQPGGYFCGRFGLVARLAATAFDDSFGGVGRRHPGPPSPNAEMTTATGRSSPR